MHDASVTTALIGLLAAAVYTDLRFGRIYNRLTLPCIALGMVLRTTAHGIEGLIGSFCGAALVLVLFALFAPRVGIGGGDVKLMMAVGALTGLEFALWTMLISAVIGGIIALVVIMRRRVVSQTVSGLAGSLYPGVPMEVASGANQVRIPYSAAIALGTLATFLLKRRLGLA